MENVQENRSAKPTELTGLKFLTQIISYGPNAYGNGITMTKDRGEQSQWPTEQK
jgi:hypothetical protein